MKVAFLTLGCKTNQYETNAMSQKFIEAGFEICDIDDSPDIYVVNTCTVTNIADRKSRQALRKVKAKNPNTIVAAVGCYAQIAKEELEKMDEIDIVLGNKEKKDIVKYIQEKTWHQLAEKTKKEPAPNGQMAKKAKREPAPNGKKSQKRTGTKWQKIVEVSDISKQKDYDEYGSVTYTEKTRAVIKIQDGCNQFCSYCLIPYARGRIRSRSKDNIINEVKAIVNKGIKEIVLTGIHIASYGEDLEDNYRLIDLLEDLNNLQGIERIRLGSLEPTIVDDAFVLRIKNLEKICRHFHLSLQSGCDATLKRMNRKYTISQFKEVCKRLRNNMENVNLTTDIIVGFPGETEEEFNQTYEFLKEIAFYKMHVFKYSKRDGTLAALMPNQVDGAIAEERSKKLIELSEQTQKMYNEKYIGQEMKVLFEEKQGDYWVGHTDNFMVVKLKSNEELDGKIKKVCIKEGDIENEN